jgi:hypothetical protein
MHQLRRSLRDAIRKSLEAYGLRNTSPEVVSGEPPLLVFISSLQSANLQAARDLATETIRSFDIPPTIAWAFEYTPASPDPPDKKYLRHARECDIFIWLVGDVTTNPVKNEVNEAIVAKRNMLVYPLTQTRDMETQVLLNKAGKSAKYQEATLQDLGQKMTHAIGDMLICALRNRPSIGLIESLDEMERRSKARCVASWQALGVPTEIALEFSEDSRVGKPTVEMLPTTERPVVLITGNIGSGKSLISERLYQGWIRDFRDDCDAPLPVFLKAQTSAGNLEEEIIRTCSSIGDPRLQGVRVVADGADEAGIAPAASLLEEARTLSRTWPNSAIAITSRPIPVSASEESVRVPGLDEIGQIALVQKCARRETVTGIHLHLPESVKDAVRQPLFAILLGIYLSENDMRSPRSTGELIAGLIEKATRDRGIDSEIVRKDLQKLAHLSTERFGGPVPQAEVAEERRIKALVETGLVVLENRCVSFQLPIFRQWFAAQELGENVDLAARLALEREQLDRWRYSYAIATATFDHKKVGSIIRPLVEADPGFAAEVINEGISGWGLSASIYPPSPAECAARVRDTMTSWLRGIQPLSHLIGPADHDGSLLPIGAVTSDAWLSTAWYCGNEHLDDIVVFGRAQSPFGAFPAGWKFQKGARPGRQSAWAWKWSHEQLVETLSKLLENRAVPLVEGAMASEYVWKVMLKLTQKGSLYNGTIGISEIEKVVSRLPDDPLGVKRNIRSTVETLRDQGGELEAPWPGPDREAQGGWIWEPYSDDRLMLRAKAVFSAALEIYTKIVETWFNNLSFRMNTASILPARLVGSVVPSIPGAQRRGAPLIAWYLDALPNGQVSTVDLSLCEDKHQWDDLPTGLRQIQSRLTKLRPEASEWITLFFTTQIFDFIFGPDPATELAYEWLWSDLKDISWVKGLLGRK